MWGDAGPDADDWQEPTAEARSEWDRRGRELHLAVQRELGADYEVGYFDEATGEVEWPAV